MNENKTAEDKDINLIAIKSLIECIDNRDIAEGGIFLDDDNAEFVADILRYHYKLLTSKNKMGEVAKIFGKELGKEFIVNDEYRKKMICKITERGLFFYHDSYEAWWQDSGLLSELITGEAVITNERDMQNK